jgi:hypothetical protein
MAKLKYAKYILQQSEATKYKKMADGPSLDSILMMNGENVPGSFHVHCAWVHPGPNPGVYEAHVHPHDEILGFIGTNPDDNSDLGAEATLWIGDEKYVMTKNFMAFLPKDLVHCPLTVLNVKWPILHFDIQLARGRPEFTWVKDLPVKKAKGAKK